MEIPFNILIGIVTSIVVMIIVFAVVGWLVSLPERRRTWKQFEEAEARMRERQAEHERFRAGVKRDIAAGGRQTSGRISYSGDED
jgi:hypothetical protein